MYLVPARARELLIKADSDSSNKAMDDFRGKLKLLPTVVKEKASDIQNIDDKRRDERTAILKEVPVYLSDSEGVDFKFDLCEFWAARATKLPHLFQLFVFVGLLQASSAAAERVFSRWQRRFGDHSIEDAREDYMESSVMAEMNDPEQ